MPASLQSHASNRGRCFRRRFASPRASSGTRRPNGTRSCAEQMEVEPPVAAMTKSLKADDECDEGEVLEFDNERAIKEEDGSRRGGDGHYGLRNASRWLRLILMASGAALMRTMRRMRTMRTMSLLVLA